MFQKKIYQLWLIGFKEGLKIVQGLFSIGYNVEALAKKGIWSTNVQPFHQSFIVAKMFNLQRQAPFLPMQC
jgi:hypothetical protein